MSNAKHLELLRSGVEKWNAWQRKHSSVRPDFREADLRGLTLVRADLRGAKLSGANLRRVNLSHANLSKADLSGATSWAQA